MSVEPPTRNHGSQALVATIAKNTLVVTAGSAVLKVINFLFNVYIIRQLGDDRYGQYSVVLAFVGLYQIFAELGISQFVMRESAKDHDQAENLFWNVVVVRLLLAIVAVLAIPNLAIAAGYSQELITGVFLYACSFLLAAVLSPLQGLLTAHERFDVVTATGVVGQIVFVILGGGFLLSGLGFIWLIVASMASMIPQIIWSAWALLKKDQLHWKITIQPRGWPGLVRSGLPFAVISLMLSITFRVDSLLLKQYWSDQVVGWYNASYNLVFSLLFLSSGFKDAIVPSLTRTYVTQPETVERWYYRTTRIMLILSLPIAVGGMLVADPLVKLLYTDSYAPAALALKILIWDVPVLMFSSFCGNISTIINQERIAARIYAVNALVNVLLNLYAIPRFGLAGAAAVTVLTDLTGAIQFFFFLRRQLNLPDIRGALFKVSLASMLMGVAVYLTVGIQLFVGIAVGVGVYLLMILLTGILDKTEWGMLRRLLPGAKGGP